MNRPPEGFVLVDEERLLNFSTACFEKSGITHDHAALISRLLVNSDLRGVRSHGTRTVIKHGYCGGFENGSFNPNPNIRIIHETPTAVVLDGNGTLGYLPMVRATEHAIAKAKEVGMELRAPVALSTRCLEQNRLGMGLVRYIGHYGSAGHYARICNEAGCIGFYSTGIPEPRERRRPRPQTTARLLRQPSHLFRHPFWRGAACCTRIIHETPTAVQPPVSWRTISVDLISMPCFRLFQRHSLRVSVILL